MKDHESPTRSDSLSLVRPKYSSQKALTVWPQARGMVGKRGDIIYSCQISGRREPKARAECTLDRHSNRAIQPSASVQVQEMPWGGALRSHIHIHSNTSRIGGSGCHQIVCTERSRTAATHHLSGRVT